MNRQPNPPNMRMDTTRGTGKWMAKAHRAENLFVVALQYPKGRFTIKATNDPTKSFIFNLYHILRESTPFLNLRTILQDEIA